MYLGGVDLIAIQEMLGHRRGSHHDEDIRVHRTRVEDARLAGQQRAATRLEGLI
jgi:integrase/recombinase XerD